MYFPERMQSIHAGHKVLEIGPGTAPHTRSDVLLEKVFANHDEHVRQCGGTPVANTDPRTVFYDGSRFPFSDGQFDYIICSHVLEHVDDLEGFCAEMFRVGRAGYIEFPLIYYDYVFDIPEHINILIKQDNTLIYERKSEILSPDLQPIRKLWYEALASGYTTTVSELAPYIMQGFEWTGGFEVRRAQSIQELYLRKFSIAPRTPQRLSLLRRLYRRFNS